MRMLACPPHPRAQPTTSLSLSLSTPVPIDIMSDYVPSSCCMWSALYRFEPTPSELIGILIENHKKDPDTVDLPQGFHIADVNQYDPDQILALPSAPDGNWYFITPPKQQRGRCPWTSKKPVKDMGFYSVQFLFFQGNDAPNRKWKMIKYKAKHQEVAHSLCVVHLSDRLP